MAADHSEDGSYVSMTCVVVAFHRASALAVLLEEIGSAHERIVVNVEADEAVRSVAARFGAVEVPIFGNPGFATAVNAGVREASGDLIAFMNDDVVISGDDLAKLGARLIEHQAAVIVPRIESVSGQMERTVMALPTPGRILLEWALLPDQPVRWLRWLPIEKWRAPTQIEAVRAATAAVVVTMSKVLTDFAMPESYFLYWEELEWFWRLGQHSERVLMDPTIVAVHTGGHEDIRIEKSWLLARNAVRCVRRTQGPRAAAIAWGAVLTWNVRLVLVAMVRRLMRGSTEASVLAARVAGLKGAVGARREISTRRGHSE